MEAFEDAADFMEALASIFDVSSGARIKTALAITLTALLTPVANATAEVNQPLWAQATQTIYTKASQMATKPRYITYALPVICAAAAASPEDQLLNTFNTCAELCLNRLKDKNLRPAAMHGILQLMYAYLRRCHESHSAVAKRLDAIVRFILPLGRKQLNPPDLHLDAPATILHFVAHRHFEYGSELILSVINPSPAISSDRWPIEALAPERMHVAIKAILLTLDSIERSEEPVLPSAPRNEENEYAEEADLVEEQKPAPLVTPLPESLLSRSGMRTFVGGCISTIAKIAMACDRACDSYNVLDDRNVVPRGAVPPPFSPEREVMYYRRHGAFQVCYPKDRQPLFDLLRCCIDSWPRLLTRDPSMPEFKPLDIILRGLVHVDVDVYQASRMALMRLARHQDGHLVVKALGRFVVRPELVLREVGPMQGAATVKLESLAKLWTEVIAAWQTALQEYSNLSNPPIAGLHLKKPGLPSTTENAADHPFAGTDPLQLMSLLNDIEASATVLMLSQSALLRRWAIEAFNVAKSSHEIIIALSKNISGSPLVSQGNSRVYEHLESSAHLLDEIDEDVLTTGEKTGLARWRKTPASKTLSRLIESDSPLDLALWHHLIPIVLNALIQLSPVVVNTARGFMAARLLKVYPAASTAAGLVPSKMPQTPLTTRAGLPSPTVYPMDITFLADHWKTHLMGLCTIISHQGLSTPVPGSAEPDKLSSGPELVRLGMPFLASDNLALRDATVQGLGCIHPALYKSLLDGLHSIVRHLSEDRKNRGDARHGGRRSSRHGRLFLAVALVHESSSKLLRTETGQMTETEVHLVSQYIQEAFSFLRDPESAEEAGLLPMRRAFCISVHNLVAYCSHDGSLQKWLPTELRHDIFSLFDSWSFRPMTLQSPDVGRSSIRSSESHSGHSRHTKGRASSSSGASQMSGCEVFLPAVNAMAAFCVSSCNTPDSHPADEGKLPGARCYQHKKRKSRATSGSRRSRSAQVGTGIARSTTKHWSWSSKVSEPCLNEHWVSAQFIFRRALGGLIGSNLDNRTFLDATVFQCFAETDNLPLPQSTFSVLSGALIAEPSIAIKSSTAVCLALWKLAHADLPTRQRALDILTTRLPPDFRAEMAGVCEPAIYSTFGGALLHARSYLCDRLAASGLADGRAVFLELAIRILQVAGKQTRLLLQLLPSWLSKVVLPQHRPRRKDVTPTLPQPSTASTDPVLANLFLLSAKYADVYQLEMRSMWLALAGSPESNNFLPVLHFLVQETARRGSKEFTKHAQRIIGCLSDFTNAASVLTYLASMIQPAEILDMVDSKSANSAKRTNLDTLFPISPRRMPLSFAQAALLITGDAAVTRIDKADPNIARILHILVMHADHSTSFIRLQARDILARLATLLNKLDKTNVRASANGLPLPGPAEVLWEWRQFWEHDDRPTSSAQTSPANMDKLLLDLLALLKRRVPDLDRLWGSVSLEWATSCPLRHMACRSLQIFRLLVPTVDQRMLAEMLSRLADSVSDQSGDSHVFAYELLLTLATVVKISPASVMQDVPQLFWASLACIESANEMEVAQACKVAGLAMERLDQLSDDAITAIAKVRPEQFDLPKMLRHLAWRGFASTTTIEASWHFFVTLTSCPNAMSLMSVVDTIHLLLPIALLYALQALETATPDDELIAFTEAVSTLATANEHHNVARIMTSLGKNRFRSKEDLVRQSISCFAEFTNAPQRVEIFIFYLSALNNPLEWVRLRSLTILKALTRQVSLDEKEVEKFGPDLLKPLVRLLQSEMAPMVLEVLDEKIPVQQDVLGKPNAALSNPTASTSRPGTSNSRRPGYFPEMDIPQALSDVSNLFFGEPALSGWCFPQPLEASETVRNKLRALVESCGLQADTSLHNSPFEFATEDDHFSHENDFSFSETRSQVDGDVSGLGEMVSTLHDLSRFALPSYISCYVVELTCSLQLL